MMWSTVAKVRCGKRTGSFISRSIWKACGLVTSWIRWSPIRSWVWPFGSSRTACASHTLSRRLRESSRVAGSAAEDAMETIV
jgi:hypothetical protein